MGRWLPISRAQFPFKGSSDHSASRPSGTSAASKYFSPPPANRTLEQSWNSPSNYSRFSISPASNRQLLPHPPHWLRHWARGKFSTNIHTQTEWDLKNLNSQSCFSFSFSGSGEDGEKRLNNLSDTYKYWRYVTDVFDLKALIASQAALVFIWGYEEDCRDWADGNLCSAQSSGFP